MQLTCDAPGRGDRETKPAHQLLAAVTTAYILVAIQLEERDLVAGRPVCDEYRQRVPMLVPTPGKMWQGEEVGVEMG